MVDITINGNTYFSYISVADADTFLFVYPDTTTWFTLSIDDKGKNLVAASSFLDSLPWADACGTQAIRETKQGVINATALIANLIANGVTAFFGTTTQEAGTKRFKAGSTEIEFFADINKMFYYNPNNLAAGLPPYIFALIKGCLSGSGGGLTGSIAFGTDYESTASWPWDLTG